MNTLLGILAQLSPEFFTAGTKIAVDGVDRDTVRKHLHAALLLGIVQKSGGAADAAYALTPFGVGVRDLLESMEKN